MTGVCDMSPTGVRTASSYGFWGSLGAPALLVAVVVVFHWGALWDGVRHDDHLHRYKLRTLGWSWNDLIESTTFEFPGRQMFFWWQSTPAQWRYPRPLKMLIMKVEYLLVGGAPVGLHAFSLAWHGLATLVVYGFISWLLQSWRWGLLVALLFALNPNGVLAVSWTAAHDTLISTVLLVAAVWAYARASFGADRQPAAWRGRLWLTALVLWGLSLFVREATIVFPVLALGLDAFLGGPRHAWKRRQAHVIHFVLAGAYVLWRFLVFPTQSFPGGYFEAPAHGGYVLWLVGKWVQLIGLVLLQLPLYTPLDFLGTRTSVDVVIHVVLYAVVAATLVAYGRTFGRAREAWLGPFWLAVGFAPVLPIASGPHFAYLPFVGYALCAANILRRHAGARRWWLTAGTFVVVLVAFAGHRLVNRAACRAEQLIAADIQWTTPPPPPGSKLFFINLPLPMTFTTYALREAWGVDQIDGYTLTLAPEAHCMTRASRVTRISPHELVVTTDPPGYFASVPERWSLKITGLKSRLAAGLTVRGDLFDTTILEMTGDGVTKLKFTFHEPLDREDYYFFVSTPERPAYRLRFDPAFDERALAEETDRFRAAFAPLLAERDVFVRLFERWRRR